jgi:large subunit ribosomal protein L15
MALLKRPDGAKKQKKRLGRGPGTGNGTTAGKGTKGQNARSGGGVRPGFEGGQMPLYRRIARRGFSNYPFKKHHTVINLSTLEKQFSSGDTVGLETLREKNVIGTHESLVKILGEGELTKKLSVVGVKVSRSAQAKIEAAGGSVAGGEADATGNAGVAVDHGPAEESVAAESAPEDTTTNEDDE